MAPAVAVLGAGAGLEPGDQHRFDLLVPSVWMLPTELRKPHRLPERAQVEGRSQSCRRRLRRVVSHVVIVGRARFGREG